MGQRGLSGFQSSNQPTKQVALTSSQGTIAKLMRIWSKNGREALAFEVARSCKYPMAFSTSSTTIHDLAKMRFPRMEKGLKKKPARLSLPSRAVIYASNTLGAHRAAESNPRGL